MHSVGGEKSAGEVPTQRKAPWCKSKNWNRNLQFLIIITINPFLPGDGSGLPGLVRDSRPDRWRSSRIEDGHAKEKLLKKDNKVVEGYGGLANA